MSSYLWPMRTEWMEDGVQAPGDPHTAQDDRAFITRAQGLLVNHMGTKRSYAYLDPDAAPKANVSNNETAYHFKMEDDGGTDPEWALPWYVMPRFDRIQAWLWIAVQEIRPGLHVRLTSEQLVDAVATTNSTYAEVQNWSLTSFGNWTRSEPPWWTGSAVCTLTPTLPASRRVALKAEVIIDTLGDDPSRIEFGYKPRIVRAVIRDSISDVGG